MSSTKGMVGFVRILYCVVCSRGFQLISSVDNSYISQKGAKPN